MCSEPAGDAPEDSRSGDSGAVPPPAGPINLAWRVANLRRYDLNLLLSLHALLHTRNVTLAGEWLAVTQPAMSTDLRRLRQVFADDLLVRVGREYQLTALATALIEPLT